MVVESGLRERQKTRRRTEILAAGKALFSRQGYSSTSMQAIAEAAEVGIATVYNYFGTKGSLLAEILRSDFDLLFERGEALLAQDPGELDKGVLALIAVMGPGLSAEPELGELARDAESRLMQQLAALLSLYQRDGKV